MTYKRALEIYKLDLGSVRGKIVRVKPDHVRIDIALSVPDEMLELHNSVTMGVDLLMLMVSCTVVLF